MKIHIACMFGALNASACAAFGGPHELPPSLGEEASAYGYVPLDGLAIDQTYFADSCRDPAVENATTYTPGSTIYYGGAPPKTKQWLPLLQSLPDLSIRFSVAELKTDGSLTFGPAKTTKKDQAYRAVLDYVNVDAIPKNFYARKRVKYANAAPVWEQLRAASEAGGEIVGYDIVGERRAYDISQKYFSQKAASPVVGAATDVRSSYLESASNAMTELGYDLITVPVYVGIGMRLTADVRANEGGVTLASLGAIGAAADAKLVSGTLTVQTLGVNGKSIATALPLPSKLDQTTIENGILALGSSRALIYNMDTEDGQVTATPRVVGLYSPVGTDPNLINAIYAELSSPRPEWARPCSDIVEAKTAGR